MDELRAYRVPFPRGHYIKVGFYACLGWFFMLALIFTIVGAMSFIFLGSVVAHWLPVTQEIFGVTK